ncbi:MAG: L,D-transpeptidase family protein [Patescibacteria group bacterium]
MKQTPPSLFFTLVLLMGSILMAGVILFSPAQSSTQRPTAQIPIPHSIALSIKEQKDAAFLPLYEDARDILVGVRVSFVEANLDTMKVSTYVKGERKEEIPILTKGDPQGWGGSAVGFYKIQSGGPSLFSGVSQVYMPFALKYYGKYFLHGIPYDEWGDKLASDVSGGCLRLPDAQAEALYNAVEVDMPILVIDKERDEFRYPDKNARAFPGLTTKNYLVADLDSGYIFAERNSMEQRPIASLTKLMTAVVAAENIDLRKSIGITGAMLTAHGDTEGLKEGERYRIVELFYPLLMRSSNDAAEALAGFLGNTRTIELMNEKADALLMGDTQFTDPAGFDDANISTARDLFYLGRYIANNRPPLWEISKGLEVRSFGDVRFDLATLENKNIFVNDPTFIGGKIGYLPASKHTGMFLFELPLENGDTRRVAIVLLGAPSLENLKGDTQRVYIWQLKNYFAE